MLRVSSRASLVIALGPALVFAQTLELEQFHPGRRVNYGLEFDAVRNEVIAFGAGTLSTTMWGWDGSHWRAFEPPVAGPTTRTDVKTTSDPSTGRVFAYGGGPFSTELWQWDGTTWTLLSNAGPSPRRGTGLAFDPATQALYLFGGKTPTNAELNDLWRYQGGAWTQLPATGISARFDHSMVWDPMAGGGAGGILLFGGNVDGTGFGWVNNTWLWTSAGGWVQGPSGPPLGYDHTMCRDAARNCVVLVIVPGFSNTVSQTWEWNGSSWLQRISTHAVDARR